VNLPNALTVIRILLVPLFLYKALTGDITFAAAVYIAAAITDGLDGFIARFWHMQTRLGTFLDPLADKLLIATSFVTLAILGMAPLWLTITVLSRDVIIAMGSLIVYLMQGNLTVHPRPIGKITTFFQFLYVLLVLVTVVVQTRGYKTFWTAALTDPVALLVGALTVISLAVYIIDGFRALED
jgi:cardiolipin synthase